MRLRLELAPTWQRSTDQDHWRSEDGLASIGVTRLASSAMPPTRTEEVLELATGWRGWLRRGEREVVVEIALVLGLTCRVTLEVTDPARLPAAEQDLRDALALASPDWQGDGEIRCLADLIVVG